MEVEGRDVDIRVASTALVGGEKVVMRLLDKSRSLFRLEQLGMQPDTADRYSRLIHSPYGMVICAGPTGGGKTTTLYASLGELDTPDRNIMTIEDPVEYTFDSINQIQINEQAGITFAGGLKSILRQDPDIILVGEIRDVDTARIAVQSALTGHLVLSSLHATEAVSALYRLVDMGIEPFLIASSVTAVVAQRLVRRSCTSCLEPYTPVTRGARVPPQRRLGRGADRRLPARRRVPLLCAHRLPRADRGLRAADRSPTRSGSWSSTGRRTTRCASSPAARACARSRSRRCGSSATGRPPPPKSCVRSTWRESDHAQVRLRRSRPSTAKRSRARTRPPAARTPRSRCTSDRSAACG